MFTLYVLPVTGWYTWSGAVEYGYGKSFL